MVLFILRLRQSVSPTANTHADIYSNTRASATFC